MAGTIRVEGLRDLQRDFQRMSKDLSKEVRDELRQIGNVVRDEARQLFVGVDARSAAGYRTRVRRGSVAVEQSKGKTTGQHPEFSGLQLRRALTPVLVSKSDETVESLDRMLGRLAGHNGF